MIKCDNYTDGLSYPCKPKTPTEANKLVNNMRLLMGSELEAVVFPQERFATREAIDTAMYAMHDMVQCIGTKSGFVNATKSGRISVEAHSTLTNISSAPSIPTHAKIKTSMRLF